MNRRPLLYQLLSESAAEPKRAMRGDVGYDLTISRTTTIQPGEYADVPHDIAFELPEATWGLLTGRSSALRKRGLHVMQGVIDNGYRGPIFAGCWNLTESPVTLEVGERVAQLILMPMILYAVEQAHSLSSSPRGINGFGSTGK